MTAMLGVVKENGSGYEYSKATISNLNHFEFGDKGIMCWQHSKIGSGTLLKIKDTKKKMKDMLAKYVVSNGTDAQKTKLHPYNRPGTQDTSSVDEDTASGDQDTPSNENSSVTFSCHNKACDRVFRSYEELEQHNMGPSCSYRKYSQDMYQYISTVSIFFLKKN